MNVKKIIINLLSIGIVVGFVAGLTSFLYMIISNRYLQYKMLRLVVHTLQRSLNRWIVVSITVSSIAYIIAILSFRFGTKIIRKPFLADMVEVHIKDRNRAMTLLLAFMASFLFFFFGGWAINHYWLPHRFHPVSLLGDAGILLFTIFLWWFLIKINIFKVLTTRYFRRMVFLLMIFLGILNIGIVADSNINTPKGPNCILIMVDALRADHLSCYGYSRKTSPNIDKFSSESILFGNAIASAPWTTPSVGSLFTSQYPAVLGIGKEPVKMDNKFLTLAEILKENNYLTKGIISNSCISSKLDFNQGFDSYDEENAIYDDTLVFSPSIARKAISFLEKNKNSRFFLFLFFYDPHSFYTLHDDYDYYPDYDGPFYSSQPLKELLEKAPNMSADDVKYIKALYDSEISFTDEYIGRFLDKLKELGLYGNSLIIFTADHGEEFCERGDYWIGHGKTLYQELIHVPLIIKLPGDNKGIIIDEYVGLIDLMPTVVDCIGLKIPDGYEYEGEVIDIGDARGQRNRKIISETENRATLQSVIWKGWKLVYDSKKGLRKLFDLKDDPKETKDLALENEKMLKEMEKILQSWNNHVKLKKLQREIKAQKPDFTEEEKERLRALGYLQ